MNDLTDSEKYKIQRLLRSEFDRFVAPHENEKSICFEVISIATKLQLNTDFINELESDYNLEFN